MPAAFSRLIKRIQYGIRMNINWLTRIYTYLLKCFPSMYRKEYEEELVYTFRMAARDTVERRGTSQLMLFAWRELRDLPWAALQAHLDERRRTMKHLPGAHLPGEPVVRWRLAAALLPFIVFIIYTLLDNPLMTGTAKNLAGALVLTMVVGILVLAVYGIVRGLPTWSLPAWSIPFFMVNMLSIQSAYGLFAWPAAQSERILIMITRSLVSYAGALVLGLSLLFLVRPFYSRVRQDWTLLAFLFFCGFALFTIFFDPYIGLEIYETGAFVLMGFGALVFLLVPKKWQRFTVLAAALILAFALVSWGIYTIFPEQSFARGRDIRTWRTWEAIQPLLMLPGMLFTLALAPLLSRLLDLFQRQQPAGSQPA
jgi:hypothetical protein